MFSGASLAGPLASEMEKISLLAPYAREISMVTVMVLVTYFSLIIGELVPKWIAIAVPEKAACVIARPMIIMATACRPLVWFSTWSTKIVVGFLGVKMGGEQPVSEEEIKVLLQQGARLGTFDKEEPEIIDNVFELNDRTASDCMTARPQLDWLDLEDEEKKIWADMMETSHFRLPVGKGSLDDGWSGTNFDRPAFCRMIEDIEAGLVNMVITKDLSRLGRDYILTGHYMERYFPEKGVRYLSLLDGIDTGVESTANDITPFRAIMNDMYAKDISKKIKSAGFNKIYHLSLIYFNFI